jgi:7-cyano-7-deazaguanine reductase
MMISFEQSNPLGQKTAYISQYNPALLFSIARREARDLLNLKTDLPFFGFDLWSAYELSWLNSLGMPEVAVGEFKVPCDSPFIIESKSFKLYLNSFNQSQFESSQQLMDCLVKDLSKAAGVNVSVSLQSLQDSAMLISNDIRGTCIDQLKVFTDTYHPHPDFLVVDASIQVKETLYSHLFKSNCPVTGQPDWASIFVEYRGSKIDHENLLRYLISFRAHQDFHENCVERMFIDILERCKPQCLSVCARYTRRGGLDINPFRSTEKNATPEVGRLLRQ